MAKKVIIVFGVVFLFIFFSKAYASIYINEVKYSPTAKQWIEVYNDTDNDIDITTYKILDSGASTNGHSIIPSSDGKNIISKHGFGVVAKAPDDFSGLSCSTFKSSLNIKVSSDNLVLRNESGDDVSSVLIDGTAIDGNSYQLLNGTWKSALPTPCMQNAESNNNSNTIVASGGSTNTNLVSDTDKVPEKLNIVEVPHINTKIIAKNQWFTNIPMEFGVENIGYSGEIMNYGKNYWNFGDGDSKEQINNFNKFTHTFSYPGEYVVSLEYYQNSFSEKPDAVNKVVIKIVLINVFISNIGEKDDPFVELINNSDYEIDISKWMLSTPDSNFIFPKNTIIPGKGKLILSPKITKFSSENINDVKLFNQTGEIIHRPENTVIDSKENTKIESKNKEKYQRTKKQAVNQSNSKTEIIPSQLEGSAIKSEKVKDVSYWFFVIFVILLLIAAGAVYFIRRRSNFSPGDEFEILDE